MPASLECLDTRSPLRPASEGPDAGTSPEPRRRGAHRGLSRSPRSGAMPPAPGPRHLDAARAGDHLDRLYRTARALTGSAQEADDVVQETYARVLSRPRLVHAENDLGYLMAAVRHTFIDGRRRRRAEQLSLEELPFEPVALSSRGQPEPEAAAREVYAAIAELPQVHREALAAIDVMGLSYRETADVLGVPLGTVMSRLYRARGRLAAQFADCAA
jgi:RNA polymerase sigma-70 factor, ECF subfamily